MSKQAHILGAKRFLAGRPVASQITGPRWADDDGGAKLVENVMNREEIVEVLGSFEFVLWDQLVACIHPFGSRSAKATTRQLCERRDNRNTLRNAAEHQDRLGPLLKASLAGPSYRGSSGWLPSQRGCRPGFRERPASAGRRPPLRRSGRRDQGLSPPTALRNSLPQALVPWGKPTLPTLGEPFSIRLMRLGLIGACCLKSWASKQPGCVGRLVP